MTEYSLYDRIKNYSPAVIGPARDTLLGLPGTPYFDKDVEFDKEVEMTNGHSYEQLHCQTDSMCVSVVPRRCGRENTGVMRASAAAGYHLLTTVHKSTRQNGDFVIVSSTLWLLPVLWSLWCG